MKVIKMKDNIKYLGYHQGYHEFVLSEDEILRIRKAKVVLTNGQSVFFLKENGAIQPGYSTLTRESYLESLDRKGLQRRMNS